MLLAGIQLRGTYARYSVQGALGKGAFGAVFRAVRHDGAQVAVKVLHDLGNRDAVRRFRREIELLRSLRHSNIVPMLDSGQDGDGSPFYVMPVMMENLAAVIDRERAWEDVLNVIAGVADGLAYYHAKKGMHRDVKPENVLIDLHGTPKLADFGVARCEAITGSSATRTACGTEPYMAPEVWASQAVPASDIYALGIVLWELANGTRHAVPARPPALKMGAGKLAALEKLYGQMTSANPRHRPTASAVASRCRGILRALEQAEQPKSQDWQDVAVGVAAAAVGVGVGVWIASLFDD